MNSHEFDEAYEEELEEAEELLMESDTEASYYETSSVDIAMRPKPDSVRDPAGEAGWFLERERLLRGEQLEDISALISIHPYHLDAIEYGDMTRMPRRPETLEMIGTYAQYLGFSPGPLVKHYTNFLSPSLQSQRRSYADPEHAIHPATHPAPLSSAKILPFSRAIKTAGLKYLNGGTGGVIASIGAAVLLFAAIGWLLPSTQPISQGNLAQENTHITDPLVTASTNPMADNIKVTHEAMSETDDQNENYDIDPEGDAMASLINKTIPSANSSANSKKAKPQANASTENIMIAEGNSRLSLRAKAPVWVRIEDAQGNVVMTKMLMKDDVYKVPNRLGLIVIARDGGALAYMIDGKEKGILGTPGEILVGRSLDIKQLIQGKQS